MVNRDCDDSIYRYKIVWYNELRKVINREFFCNMTEVCNKLEIKKPTLVHLLKDTAHKDKWKNIKIERVYIPRKVVSYYTYSYNENDINSSDSDSDSD